jgi:hypothetical protein
MVTLFRTAVLGTLAYVRARRLSAAGGYRASGVATVDQPAKS